MVSAILVTEDNSVAAMAATMEGQTANQIDDETMTATKDPTNWKQLLGDDRRLRSSLS